MKQNDIVYLKDGRKASYECELGEKHVVQIYMIYYSEDGEYEDLGEITIVNEVFSEAPINVVSERITTLEKQKTELTKAVQELNLEKTYLNNYISQKTDFKKHIINKSELMRAKSIAFFVKGQLMPTSLKDKGVSGLKIHLQISIFRNEERAWGYKLYNDNGDYSEYITDPETDILIDKTQKEIDLATTERIKKIQDPSKIYEPYWVSIDNKYLTPELIKHKQKIIDKDIEDKKSNKLAKIEILKKELSKLN